MFNLTPKSSFHRGDAGCSHHHGVALIFYAMINLLSATLDPFVKRIPLTQGQFALVDAEHYESLSVHKWRAQWDEDTQSYYALRSRRLPNGKQAAVLMHREIMGLQRGDKREVDHVKSGDTLNNIRTNLKVATRRQNSENQRNQSQYGVGVYLQPSGRFRSQAKTDGKLTYLGTFDTPEEASTAREVFLV